MWQPKISLLLSVTVVFIVLYVAVTWNRPIISNVLVCPKNRVGLVPANTIMNGDIDGGLKLCLAVDRVITQDIDELKKNENKGR